MIASKENMDSTDCFLEILSAYQSSDSGCQVSLLEYCHRFGVDYYKFLGWYRHYKCQLTPKEFIRIVRMQRALSMLQQDATIPFVQVAYECGFSDQSHMIKEFKLFSGYTPAEYLSVCAPYSDYFSEL